MPARIRKIRHDEETRLKIKTTQLINRLQNHVFKKAKLTVTQLKAIEILLKKTVPDVSSVDAKVSGELTTYVIGSNPMSADDWEATYSVGTSDGTPESLN